MTKVFMLLFNLSIVTPEGISRDEIVNVYSKHFETELECQQFLDNWSSIIRSRGVDTLQDMLKDGYRFGEWQIYNDKGDLIEEVEYDKKGNPITKN